MAYGLNRADIIGRLGNDVAINELSSGGRRANFSVATDESYVNKEKNERVDRVEWHRVVTFQDGLVKLLEKHGKKGRLVFVSGSLQTRSWRKEGESADRLSTDIILGWGGKVTFLDKLGDDEAGEPGNESEPAGADAGSGAEDGGDAAP